MDMKEFLDTHSEEDLQKVAEQAQNELVEKVASIIVDKLPEMIKSLVKTAMDELKEEQEEHEDEKKEDEIEDGIDVTKDNTLVDPSVNIGGLKANDVKEAAYEAIAAGQAGKIIELIKAISEQYPDSVNEAVKILKSVIQDAIMKKLIEPEEGVKISQQLNGGE